MTATELTWQAIALYGVLISLGAVAVLYGLAKTVKAWRDAFK